jgi:hypothetical protein
MNDDFRVVESRMETDGSRRHVVQAPGGIVDVREDDAGNLSGQLRSGYVETNESEGQALARALEAVSELHQGANSPERIESNRSRDFQDE